MEQEAAICMRCGPKPLLPANGSSRRGRTWPPAARWPSPSAVLRRRCRLGSSREQRTPRAALTLIELLVSIVIVGILASAMLFAMTAATDSAKEAKTRTTINKLHALLMERWESYKTRRLPMATAGRAPQEVAALRLKLIREIMMLELPDRWREVVLDKNRPFDPKKNNPDYPVEAKLLTLTLTGRTPLSRAYVNRYLAIKRRNNGVDPTIANEGAECLYMIITMATGDGEALAQFSQRDIGDVDDDGALEFLDGWGNPIKFIRWPTGFKSDLQDLNPATRGPENHDPFDAFHVDQEAYFTMPLIYSAGPDEGFDIAPDPEVGFAYEVKQVQNDPNVWSVLLIDPYAIIKPNDPQQKTFRRGQQMDVDTGGDQKWQDNIHNHLLGLR